MHNRCTLFTNIIADSIVILSKLIIDPATPTRHRPQKLNEYATNYSITASNNWSARHYCRLLFTVYSLAFTAEIEST